MNILAIKRSELVVLLAFGEILLWQVSLCEACGCGARGRAGWSVLSSAVKIAALTARVENGRGKGKGVGVKLL